MDGWVPAKEECEVVFVILNSLILVLLRFFIQSHGFLKTQAKEVNTKSYYETNETKAERLLLVTCDH